MKSKSISAKSHKNAGLKMVGGAAAGAAAGSLVGPIGAAVGAVLGGIAGANADEIAASKPVQKLSSATRKTVTKVSSRKPVKKVLGNLLPAKSHKKNSAKTGAKRKKVQRAK